MSQWLTDTLALINTIAVGGSDQETKKAVADLVTRMNANDMSDTEFQKAITALVQKLQASTPPGAVPALMAISPSSGSTTGGETITVSGTGFTGVTGVNVGTIAATNVQVQSDTSLTYTSPAQDSGAEDVTVVSPAGTSPVVAAGSFTYS